MAPRSMKLRRAEAGAGYAGWRGAVLAGGSGGGWVEALSGWWGGLRAGAVAWRRVWWGLGRSTMIWATPRMTPAGTGTLMEPPPASESWEPGTMMSRSPVRKMTLRWAS